uniref:Uncharacterized protein n=1 Tax=Knipowitschia caucasica TaxID=637954 RepID=A0AAV2KEJ2_KNICA
MGQGHSQLTISLDDTSAAEIRFATEQLSSSAAGGFGGNRVRCPERGQETAAAAQPSLTATVAVLAALRLSCLRGEGGEEGVGGVGHPASFTLFVKTWQEQDSVQWDRLALIGSTGK